MDSDNSILCSDEVVTQSDSDVMNQCIHPNPIKAKSLDYVSRNMEMA